MAGLETSLVMPEGPTLGRRRLMKGAGAGAVALGTLGGASIATSTAASAPPKTHPPKKNIEREHPKQEPQV